LKIDVLQKIAPATPEQKLLRLCLGVWRGGEGKALERWKYRGKW